MRAVKTEAESLLARRSAQPCVNIVLTKSPLHGGLLAAGQVLDTEEASC